MDYSQLRFIRVNQSVPCLAVHRFGKPSLRAGGADIAGGRRGDTQGCFQGCAPQGLAIQYRLQYLYTVRLQNSRYWVAPDVIVAQGSKSRVRDFGRNWDLSRQSAEFAHVDEQGPYIPHHD